MSDVSQNKNLHWVNAVKAVCMICVYWAHAEAYCPISGALSIMPWISPFYVNGFFIVSGYLFFYSLSRTGQDTFVWYKFKNIFFRLFIPTIIFPTLIFIPKMFFHASQITFFSYFYNVIGGISSWFTSALFVTQLLMLLLYLILRKKIIYYFLISLFVLILVAIFRSDHPNPFPWYWKSGLSGCFLFALGGIYHRYEKVFDDYNCPVIVLTAGILLSCSCSRISPAWVMMSCNFSISGFIIMAASSMLLFQLMKKIPVSGILDYIGKNSIVFYFFSGTLPALCGTLWRKTSPGTTSYFLIFGVNIITLSLAFAISLCINRYATFLLDLRKWPIKHN